MSQKTKSLVGGISILGLAGLICKVVGVLYRIPLAAYIGAEGLGLYSKVFQSYNLLLTISSAGLPVAISRMVAHYVTRQDPSAARRVFRLAAWGLTALGLLATLLLVIFSGWLSNQAGAPEIRIGYLAIAPSLLLVCVMSAYRGYMQGHRKMMPTAISQLIVQVGKLAVALPMAVAGMNLGGAPGGAAGMLLGTSVAEGAALVFMGIAHRRAGGEFAAVPQNSTEPAPETAQLVKTLLKISIPITLSSCIVPLAGWIDSFMVTNLMEADGMAHAEALVRYGLYSSVVLSLINVPTALAMAMSTNLVPAISAGMARHDMKDVSRQSIDGMRIASIVGMPCSMGMSLLARPILYLLFSAKYTPAQLDLGAQILQMSAFTIFFFTMVQATSGILHGCGKQRLPLYTLLAGVICKIGLNYLLIGTPSINIHGAPIASLVCYTVSMVPNLYFVVRYASKRFPVTDILLRPLAATVAMGAIVYVIWYVLFTEKCLTGGRFLLLIAVAVAILAGIAVYALLAFAIKAIRPEDVPGRLRRFVKR